MDDVELLKGGARFEIRIPAGGFRIKDGSGGTHGDARI